MDMTADRAKQLLFCALQMLRKQHRSEFYDWRDCDDWIFAELDMEKGEIEEVFGPYETEMVYGHAAYNDGDSPKDFDRRFFCIDGKENVK